MHNPKSKEDKLHRDAEVFYIKLYVFLLVC